MPTCLAICGTTTPPVGQGPSEERHRSTVLYEDVVRPACEQLGLDFLRADRLTEAGLPLEQLLHILTEVDVVVADLGESDAELSFGLGMRHALGRSTVHVTEKTGRVLRQGMATFRLLFPSPTADTAAARRQLTGVLAEALCGRGSPSSPEEPASRPGAQPVTADDEAVPGLFDLVVEAEAQLDALSEDMADVESAMTDLGEMMELIAEDMTRASHPGASMNTKMAVVNRLAKAIDGPTDDLEAAAERFAARMGASVDAFRAFLEWAGGTPRSEWPEGAESVLEQVASAPWEVQSAAGTFQEVTAVINMLGASSRQLRRPARRITGSLQAILRSVSVLEELQGLAVALKES
ncbi:hypothetical protein [Streptomyces flavofungini]|uniref:hypothetical protein n=1 Tax=Streptomyces flavofungini TaxID=68200 RepID=UPI0034DE6264